MDIRKHGSWIYPVRGILDVSISNSPQRSSRCRQRSQVETQGNYMQRKRRAEPSSRQVSCTASPSLPNGNSTLEARRAEPWREESWASRDGRSSIHPKDTGAGLSTHGSLQQVMAYGQVVCFQAKGASQVKALRRATTETGGQGEQSVQRAPPRPFLGS